jgi:diguanylate cyclase
LKLLEVEQTAALQSRILINRLELEEARTHDRGLPMAAAMIDIDHFKAVNDTHGHAVGDRVLGELASLLRQAPRGSDIAARLGGEEFLVVLVDTPQDLATEVCERLRLTVQNHPSHNLASGLDCTIGLGLHLLAADENLAACLARADALLYAAQRGGRNRVALAGA